MGKARNEVEVKNGSTRLDCILERLRNRIKDVVSSQINNCSNSLIISTSGPGATAYTEADDDEEDDIVLYGMICAGPNQDKAHAIYEEIISFKSK